MQTFDYLCNNKPRVRPHKNLKDMKNAKETIKEIAKKNPDGFTVELTTFKKVTHGISVAYLETQNSFDDEGLEKVINHAKKHDNTVGGWLNEDNNKFYYDSIKIFNNLEKAIEFGSENQQIAIFDITNLKLIKL